MGEYKKTEILRAAQLLREGKLVAFPTETVYGLGGDARNEAVIRQIFAAKKRPFNHPFIVHLGTEAEISQWARTISPAAMKLAKAFWPGPLTLILAKQPQVSSLMTAGKDTVGLRIPHHPIAQALLKEFGRGIAAPSANQFTHISPTTAEAVREELGERVDLVLDGGQCAIGLESTVVDMSGDQPRVLRPGMISTQEIAKALGLARIDCYQGSEILSPGMHHLHYAPQTKTILKKTKELQEFLHHNKNKTIAVLVRTAINYSIHSTTEVVMMAQDPKQYAHDLYQTLRRLDQQHYQLLVVEMVPETEEWQAISDRLKKASGS